MLFLLLLRPPSSNISASKPLPHPHLHLNFFCTSAAVRLLGSLLFLWASSFFLIYYTLQTSSFFYSSSLPSSIIQGKKGKRTEGKKAMSSAMYSYGLDRSGSTAMMRSSSISSIGYCPTLPRIQRSESVPDVTGYFRPFQRSRPQWISPPYKRPVRLRQQYPFRRERNRQMTEVYWRDRYYYFSPLYKPFDSKLGYSYRRPFESEYGTHIYSYWARYNGYGYDRRHPGYNRQYYYPIADYFG